MVFGHILLNALMCHAFLYRKCKAFGPGLEKGIVNQPNRFTIDTRGAGTGGLGLAIEVSAIFLANFK